MNELAARLGDSCYVLLALNFFWGLYSIIMGWRAGDRGFHLAWLGVFFGLTGQGLAIGAYRFPQLAFEGSLPPLIQAIWPF